MDVLKGIRENKYILNVRGSMLISIISEINIEHRKRKAKGYRKIKYNLKKFTKMKTRLKITKVFTLKTVYKTVILINQVSLDIPLHK